ncbi:hypothetical protein [Catellatospora chokoriensis]|uniref:hypothetical protein n=1 Tax=Catellatospora chokoriensis TaxID=310353 RepID=UPI00178553F9|nr:hypothetical protein [Catellatospora chokoriensis]
MNQMVTSHAFGGNARPVMRGTTRSSGGPQGAGVEVMAPGGGPFVDAVEDMGQMLPGSDDEEVLDTVT